METIGLFLFSPPMRPKTPTRLGKLRIREVSLVDAPANQHASVLLAKRDGEGAPAGDESSILEKIGRLLGLTPPAAADTHQPAAGDPGDSHITETDDMKTATELALEKALARIEELEKVGTPAVPVAPVGKKDDKPAEPAADVLKGLAPEVRAIVEKAQATAAEAQKSAADATTEIRKLREENADRERLTLAKSMVGTTGVKAEEVASLLKTLDEKGQKTLQDMFAKHQAVIKESGLFQELGTREAAAQGTVEVLEKKAEEIKKANPKLTDEQAMAQAITANPELYAAAVAG